MPFCRNVKLPSYKLFLWRNCRMCYQRFCFLCPCSLLFFTATHFHLAGHCLSAGRWHFSFSHRRYEISCFSSNEIRLLWFQSLALALSLLSTWVEKSKITSKKTRLCCCCFLSLAMWFPSKYIKAWVAFGLSYLFIELFYIGVPVVWMNGPGYGHVIAKISWMGRLPHFLTYGTQLREGESSAISQWGEKTKRVSRLRSLASWPASILHGETTGSVRDHLLYLVLGCSGPQDNLTVLRWAPTYKNQKEIIAGILKTSMKPCRTAVRPQWGMLSMVHT